MPSTSAKQARFMAAAAHDPAFAERAGIKRKTAKEFNEADTGTQLLKQGMQAQELRRARAKRNDSAP